MLSRFKSIILLFDAYTFVVWVWIVAEFLSQGSVHIPSTITTLYLTLVGVYVGDKEIQRKRRRFLSRNQRGELFVLLWVVTLIAFSLIVAFHGYRNGYRIPPDIPIITGTVLILWLISEYLKKQRR